MEKIKQLLPIQERQPFKYANEVFTTELILEHQRSVYEKSEPLNLEFDSFNNRLNQYKQKIKPIGSILDEYAEKLSIYSKEIASLETRSRSANVNFKVFDDVDKTILERVIPPNYVKDVSGNVNVDTIKFLEKASPSEEIDLLKYKAVESIRNKLIQSIRQLRDGKPSQLVQKEMIDQRELYHFLYENHSELAIQLRTAYFYTMRWYYKSTFTKYIHALEHIKPKPIEPFSHEYLNLEKRKLESPKAILGQIAESFPFQKYFDFVYIQFLTALFDNVVTEYYFTVDYFYFGNEKEIRVADIFDPVFELGKKFLTALNPDAFGVLNIINFINESHKYKIPILDDYCNQLLLILWPLFSKLIDNTCEILKREMLKNKKITLAPLNITQQFGQYYSNLLKLTPISNSIIRLRSTYEKYLTNLSNALKEGKEMFLYNNFFIISSILKNDEQDDKHFQLLIDAYNKK